MKKTKTNPNKRIFILSTIIVISVVLFAMMMIGNTSKNEFSSVRAETPINLAAIKTLPPSLANPTLKHVFKLKLKIQNMYCSQCSYNIIGAMKSLVGVLDAEANSETGEGWVIYKHDVIDSTKILEHPIFIIYPSSILSDGIYEFADQG